MERYVSGPDYLARKYTLEDVLRVQEDAARLQNEVNAQVMTALVGGLGRAIRWTAKGTARVLRDHWVGMAAYRVSNELNRLSDRQLAQLGTSREAIASYVADVVAPEAAEKPAALWAIEGGRRAAKKAASPKQPVHRRAA